MESVHGDSADDSGEISASAAAGDDRREMDEVFQLCRKDDWNAVLTRINAQPWTIVTLMTMDNNITTTCLHQAITSKAQIHMRATVIRRILELSPHAARIKNGYGSLPLHVIAQRNTKMKSETKEELIFELVQAYPGALVEEGGVGKRTPLHIIFTDYVSPRLTQVMVNLGRQACFMKDKKGYLPAHVAASRHCSPEKLRMLLAVNPASLKDTTYSGDTLLSLAMSTATKSHPNYALIDELHRQLSMATPTTPNPRTSRSRQRSQPSFVGPDHSSSTMMIHHLDPSLPQLSMSTSSDSSSWSMRCRLDSNESHKSWHAVGPSPLPVLGTTMTTTPPRQLLYPPNPHNNHNSTAASSPSSPTPPAQRRRKLIPSFSSSRSRRKNAPPEVCVEANGTSTGPAGTATRTTVVDDPVGLLLHFQKTQIITAQTRKNRNHPHFPSSYPNSHYYSFPRPSSSFQNSYTYSYSYCPPPLYHHPYPAAAAAWVVEPSSPSTSPPEEVKDEGDLPSCNRVASPMNVAQV